MAELKTLQPLDELAAWTSSESWGSLFLERQRLDGHESGAWMDDEARLDGAFERQIEEATQFPIPETRKRKRDINSGSAMDSSLDAMSVAQNSDVVVFGANGHRRGTNQHQGSLRVAKGGDTQQHRNETDLKRGRAILAILPGIVAILKYECGCTSRQGVCNHHSFTSGLTLPDGVVCARCKTGAKIHEIKVTRKFPRHGQDEYLNDRQRLRRLGYSEESIEMNVPTVPDLIQDFTATKEQVDICAMHLRSAMSGTQSPLGAVIRSWSREQRNYYDRHRTHLRKFPRIFSGERVKW